MNLSEATAIFSDLLGVGMFVSIASYAHLRFRQNSKKSAEGQGSCRLFMNLNVRQYDCTFASKKRIQQCQTSIAGHRNSRGLSLHFYSVLRPSSKQSP